MAHYLDHLERHAMERPEALAVSDPERALSWRALADSTDRLAAGLAAHGIAAGDRVALLETNTVRFAEIAVACAKAGAILVALNWRLAPRELVRTLRSAEPALLLVGSTSSDLGARVLAEFDACPALALEGPEVRGWRGAVPAADWAPAPRTDETPVCIAYTSGSTGAPKGVVLAHSAFSTVLPGVIEAEGITAASRCLQVLPLFHIGGFAWLISAFIAGAGSTMLASATPSEILDRVEQDRISHLCVVSTLLQMVLDEQRRRPRAGRARCRRRTCARPRTSSTARSSLCTGSARPAGSSATSS